MVHPPLIQSKIHFVHSESDKKRLNDKPRIKHVSSFLVEKHTHEDEFKKMFYSMYDEKEDYREYFYPNDQQFDELKSMFRDSKLESEVKELRDNKFEHELSDSNDILSSENPILEKCIEEDGDVSEQNMELLINTINTSDENEVEDASYVYPYHDEPLFDCSNQDTINDWTNFIKISKLSNLEMESGIVTFICRIIKATWPIHKSNTRIIYGYYMARDLDTIFEGPKLGFDVGFCIENIVGFQFDMSEIKEEWKCLDKDISYINIIRGHGSEFRNSHYLNSNRISEESIVVNDKINTWIKSWKI